MTEKKLSPEHCPICQAHSPEGMTEAQLKHILKHGVSEGQFKRVKKEGEDAFTLTQKGIERAEMIISKLMAESKRRNIR